VRLTVPAASRRGGAPLPAGSSTLPPNTPLAHSRTLGEDGRRADAKDCLRLAELFECGLPRGSYIPPQALKDLRDLTRYRVKTVQARTSEIQRLAKALESTGHQARLGGLRSDRQVRDGDDRGADRRGAAWAGAGGPGDSDGVMLGQRVSGIGSFRSSAAFRLGLDAGEGGADCRLPRGRDPAGPQSDRRRQAGHSTSYPALPDAAKRGSRVGRLPACLRRVRTFLLVDETGRRIWVRLRLLGVGQRGH
jgi:hypothetical protein